MAVHHLAVAARQHGTLKSKFADATAHAIHGGIVLAGVAGVVDQPVYGPDLHLPELGWWNLGLWGGAIAGALRNRRRVRLPSVVLVESTGPGPRRMSRRAFPPAIRSGSAVASAARLVVFRFGFLFIWQLFLYVSQDCLSQPETEQPEPAP